MTAVSEAARAPTMFMIPVAVPLNWPPTSMQTAHDGPSTTSRKKNDNVKQRTDTDRLVVMAAGMTKSPAEQKARHGYDAAP